jgi:hypothetical protein
VIANRPDINKDKKEENVRTDRYGIIRGQKCHAKESREETCQELVYRDTTNVEHEMHDYTGSNWIHRTSNKMLQKNL